MLSILIVAATLLAQAGTQPPREVELKYVKEGDLTIASRRLGFFTDDAGTHLLSLYAYHKGRDPKAIKEVLIHIYRYGPQWEYRKDHDVEVSCGKAKLNPRKVTYESRKGTVDPDNPCIETFDLRVSVEDLQTLLERDQDLNVKLGGRESCVLHSPTRRKLLKFVKAARAGEY